MKINVGDYVRTKTGIHKIFEINENATVWKYLCDKKLTGKWDGSYEYTTIKEENIIKSAEGTPRGLLDLIEVGDYVNGYKVESVNTEYAPYGVYIEIPFVGSESIGCNIDLIRTEEIKSIVTKEQFESMQYIVKES